MSGTATLNDGRTFVLEYIGEEGHLWKEMNIQKLNQLSYVSNGNRGENTPFQDFIKLPPGNVNRRERNHLLKGTKDNTTMAFISVKIYFTREFAKITNNINDFVNKMLAITNQGFLNSKVPITVVMNCLEETDLEETGSSDSILSTFAYSKSSESLRQTADTATLLVANLGRSCGNAYKDAFEGNAFSVVKKSCVETFTYGHELAHNLGCQHNIEIHKNDMYDHGHGSFIDNPYNPSQGYHTIMTYWNESYPIRINSYSNPDVIYPRANKKTGEKGKSNNAAVLLRNRFIMASVGDESQQCFLKNCLNGKCSESDLKIKKW